MPGTNPGWVSEGDGSANWASAALCDPECRTVQIGIKCARLHRLPGSMLHDGLLTADLGSQVVDEAQEGAGFIGAAALQRVGHRAPGLVHELGRRRGGIEFARFDVVLLVAAAPALHPHAGAEGGEGEVVALTDARRALAGKVIRPRLGPDRAGAEVRIGTAGVDGDVGGEGVGVGVGFHGGAHRLVSRHCPTAANAEDKLARNRPVSQLFQRLSESGAEDNSAPIPLFLYSILPSREASPQGRGRWAGGASPRPSTSSG